MHCCPPVMFVLTETGMMQFSFTETGTNKIWKLNWKFFLAAWQCYLLAKWILHFSFSLTLVDCSHGLTAYIISRPTVDKLCIFRTIDTNTVFYAKINTQHVDFEHYRLWGIKFDLVCIESVTDQLSTVSTDLPMRIGVTGLLSYCLG